MLKWVKLKGIYEEKNEKWKKMWREKLKIKGKIENEEKS